MIAFKSESTSLADANDFTKYYREHEDEFANMTTYKLNMRYKIPGYKISQKKDKTDDSEIKLVKDYRLNATSNRSSEPIINGDLAKRIEELEKRIANIETYLSNDA